MRFAFVGLVVVACSRAPSAPVEPAGPSVVLRLDGRALASVVITHPIALGELVPRVPPWILVEATAADGRFFELSEPAQTYPGAVIRLAVENGHISIGLFPAPATNVPPAVAALSAQPIVALPEITEVNVWTRPPPAPVEQGISIESKGRPTQMLGKADLDELQEHQRGRARGWRLQDVLERGAPSVKPDRVEIFGEGTQLSLPASELTANGSGLLLKRNQKGQFVLQVWGASHDRATTQIRGVTRIVIEHSARHRTP